jgi:hypothetical protein
MLRRRLENQIRTYQLLKAQLLAEQLAKQDAPDSDKKDTPVSAPENGGELQFTLENEESLQNAQTLGERDDTEDYSYIFDSLLQSNTQQHNEEDKYSFDNEENDEEDTGTDVSETSSILSDEPLPVTTLQSETQETVDEQDISMKVSFCSILTYI